MVLTQNRNEDQCNRVLKNNLTKLQPADSYEVTKTYTGEKAASSTNGAGKTKYPHEEDKLDPYV
jgi:hypothetical protein